MAGIKHIKKKTAKKGLASASPEVRSAVGQKGGRAFHRVRGLAAASPETRKRVAAMGGRS